VGGISIGRGFLWQRASTGHDANDLSLELEGISSGACEHGSCLVPDSWEEVVPCRVAGVSVGGRDLNWERIPLAEG
jgi:hypothetical protein